MSKPPPVSSDLIDQFETQGFLNSTCTFTAASAGDLEAFQWLIERGIRPHICTCLIASQKGDLEILKMAFANGCKLTEGCCIEATEFNHQEVLNWLKENNCPRSENY